MYCLLLLLPIQHEFPLFFCLSFGGKPLLPGALHLTPGFSLVISAIILGEKNPSVTANITGYKFGGAESH